MNEEIIKLAKECWPEEFRYDTGDRYVTFKFEELEAFYRAAYNKAIEDAAKVCDCDDDSDFGMGKVYSAAIRALKDQS